MKAFLTIWNVDNNLRDTKVLNCKKMVVYDGANISVGDNECQLFNVVCSDDIIPHVASIEII